MPATTPDAPTVSNQLPTSLTLTWNDCGSDVQGYYVEQWNGPDETYFTTILGAGLSTTLNVVNLNPGQFYTFAVSALWYDFGFGYGNTGNGSSTTVQMLTGCSIRDGGVWKTAVPYIRSSGHWKLALPNVRVAGVWKPAV